MLLDERADPARVRRRALHASHADAPPRKVAQAGQRAHEHVVPLPRHQGCHREQLRRVTGRGTAGRRRRIGPRPRHADPRRVDPEAPETTGREIAGDYGSGCRGQRFSLAFREAHARFCRESRLVRHGMVHQGEDAQASPVRDDRAGQAAQRQPVDEHPRSVAEPGQHAVQTRPRRGVGVGERPLQAVHVDPPAAALQSGRHPRVVDVPACLLVERAGHDQVQAGRAHGRPSYRPHATWDSCSVTAMEVTPPAPAPRSPARIAAASLSKISRARNSVVVFRPANAGSSSRLR